MTVRQSLQRISRKRILQNLTPKLKKVQNLKMKQRNTVWTTKTILNQNVLQKMGNGARAKGVPRDKGLMVLHTKSGRHALIQMRMVSAACFMSAFLIEMTQRTWVHLI